MAGGQAEWAGRALFTGFILGIERRTTELVALRAVAKSSATAGFMWANAAHKADEFRVLGQMPGDFGRVVD